MLLPRIITALVGIPLVLWAVHVGGLVYMTFVGCLIIACLYEYGLILKAGKKPVHRPALFIFGAFMGAVAVVGRTGLGAEINLPDNFYPFAVSITLLGVLFCEVITKHRSVERAALTLMGIFLIPWPLAHLINIREIPAWGEYLTLLMIFTVWACDTMAYVSGKTLGRHKMNPEVSPKKSWEGAAGGTAFAVLIALGARALFLQSALTVTQTVILGLVIAVVGQVGDLAESVIKRSTGVKDSSNLLPGHGGFLDRFDSYLLLAPVFYYTVILFL